MAPSVAEEGRSKPRSRSSSVESDFDDSYFERTYVPLSNLPTPPTSHSCDGVSVVDSSCHVDEPREPEMLGPAVHLSNLVPTSISLTTASIPLLQSILTRAALPLPIIALSVLILDSLSPRFSLSFRTSCPLSLLPSFRDRPSDDSPAFPLPTQQRVDDLHPELIPLAALVIADKFLNDRQTCTKRYAQRWGRDIWSCEQINHAERCVLVDIRWRVLNLWRPDMIHEALEDIKRAGNMGRPKGRFGGLGCNTWHQPEAEELAFGPDNEPQGIAIRGRAVTGIDGQNLTPAETPTDEEVKGTAAWIIETQKELEAEMFHDRDGSDAQQARGEAYQAWGNLALETR